MTTGDGDDLLGRLVTERMIGGQLDSDEAVELPSGAISNEPDRGTGDR